MIFNSASPTSKDCLILFDREVYLNNFIYRYKYKYKLFPFLPSCSSVILGPQTEQNQGRLGWPGGQKDCQQDEGSRGCKQTANSGSL